MTPWTAAYQAPPSMGFSRQEYWRGVPLPSLTEQLTLSFFRSKGTIEREKTVGGRLSAFFLYMSLYPFHLFLHQECSRLEFTHPLPIS